jgi:hypothetical protein
MCRPSTFTDDKLAAITALIRRAIEEDTRLIDAPFPS